MAYIDGVYERLDEIIADPRVPYGEVRDRLRQFVSEEIRTSFLNGIKSGSERPRIVTGGARSYRAVKVSRT